MEEVLSSGSKRPPLIYALPNSAPNSRLCKAGKLSFPSLHAKGHDGRGISRVPAIDLRMATASAKV